MPAVTTLIPVPTINPKNDPKAAFKAMPEVLPAINSPMKAPNSGPVTNPKGGKKNIPITSPMIHPKIPYGVPPNFLVPQTGMSPSAIVITATMMIHVSKKATEKGCCANCKSKKPA